MPSKLVSAISAGLVLLCSHTEAGLIFPYQSPYPSLPLALSSATIPPNVMMLLDNSPSMLDNLPNGTLVPTSRLAAVNLVSSQLLGKQYPVRSGLMAYDNGPIGLLPDPYKRNDGGRLYLQANQRDLVGSALDDVNGLLNGSLTVALNSLLGSICLLNCPPAPGSPMIEAYAELTRYYRGQTSLYGKPYTPLLQDTSSLINGVVGGLLGQSSSRYDSPIVYRCQRNFALVVSAEKFNDGTNDKFPFTGDTVLSDAPTPPTLGDLAERAYQRDLIGGGTDRDGASFDAADYPKQNLITYSIGFNPGADTQLKAAASRGGGRYQGVTTVSELNTAYHNAMREMSGQGSIAVPPVSVNPMSRSVFQASYQAGAWTGRLDIYPTSDAGKIDLSSRVAAKLPAPKDRRIVTTYKGLVNDLTNLVGAASDDVNQLIGINLGLGDVLGELFGEPKGRAVNLPIRRQYQLGDIIDSRPETANDGQLVAVGANDGMLHVFKRGSGDSDYTEVLGYIPSAVLWNTLYLARNDYGTFSNPHRYYVNGPLAIEKVGDDWILVGTLAQGGRGLFALKLTPLGGAAGWKASDVVLWDKTEKSDGFARLGNTFGRPIIAKVRGSDGDKTGRWAAIVANGYDSADGSASLLVVDLLSGAVLRELTVDSSGGNGLSSPAVLDTDNDDIADVVYAGDLKGEVWRFDLSGAPSNWNARKFWDGSPSQPVTSAPTLARQSGSNGYTVIFGTGRLIYDADKTAPYSTQTLYGLRDGGQPDSAYQYSDRGKTLVAQTIEKEEMAQAGSVRRMVRRVSQQTVPTTGRTGWYLDLPSANGERLVQSPVLLGSKLFLSTQIPVSAAGKCAPPGDGWIMALDAASGGRAGEPLLDLDGDEKFTAADRVRYSDQAATDIVSGVQAGLGMPTELNFLGGSSKPVSWRYYRSQDGQINNRANLYTSLNPARLGLRLTFAGAASDTSVGDLMLVAPAGVAQGIRLAWREIF